VSDKYIKYLGNHDSKVVFNKDESRPYVGVVFSINNLDYYIPLASPKPKHINMKNTIDFHKIGNGKYGALNLNNMIPVKTTELTEIDIDNESDIQYRELLYNQFHELNRMSSLIIDKAKKLYTLCTSKKALTPNDMKVKARCCDFKLLEQKLLDYSP